MYQGIEGAVSFILEILIRDPSNKEPMFLQKAIFIAKMEVKVRPVFQAIPLCPRHGRHGAFYLQNCPVRQPSL